MAVVAAIPSSRAAKSCGWKKAKSRAGEHCAERAVQDVEQVISKEGEEA